MPARGFETGREAIFRSGGSKEGGKGSAEIALDRATLGNWVGRACFHLRPIVDHLRERLKSADRIFMDETRAPVLDPGRRRTKTGYFWAVVADDRGHGAVDPPVVMFHYAPGRGAVHALRFLEGYRGRFVQCDGYEAYHKLTTVDRAEGPWMLVQCWTHARRRFVKRLEKDGSPIAQAVLRQIAELYAVEKTVRGAAPEARLAARRELSAPIIAAFRPWLEAQLSRIPRSSVLAEDIRYTLARWPGLTRFLEDGRLELDTNPVENPIRKIALTRKNALFAGHEVGAENWAMLASLIANCKMSDINPEAYLTETLRALLDGHLKSRIDELMPWNFRTTSSLAA
jgi:transposase